MQIERQTKRVDGVRFGDIDFDACIETGEPHIFSGAANHSQLVQAGNRSAEDAMQYLQSFANEKQLLNYQADSDAKGRFFYNREMNGLNFQTDYVSLQEFFNKLEAEKTAANGASFYVGSASIGHHFPGLLEEDGLAFDASQSGQFRTLKGIWLGNRTTAATHYDMSNNVAVCAVGRRRFTLFPPDQIPNLYPGPLEPTPGGQVVSMVDLRSPDIERYPRITRALQQAQVAELEPGDVLVYPAMWWHQVEALADFNVLVNFWWNRVGEHIDDPMNTLLQGLLSLRDRPEYEKQAWRNLFDYYVFGDPDTPRAHLPEHILGMLGPMDEDNARRTRVALLKKLNR